MQESCREDLLVNNVWDIKKPKCERLHHNYALNKKRELMKIDIDNARIFNHLIVK